ncbi:GAF domain-containing protein [Sulfobacillus thermotolerans]|uniref:GAF domain-containing protein n=1 Tax=Sulfobacillus thermotolerans TaxID=338644 RepID=UPI0033692869
MAALHKRKPVIFQRAASHALGPSPQHSPLESQIAVPVCDNLGCWGLLHLGYYEPDQIRPDVIQLAEGVASLFALALGYAEREESLEDQSLLGEPLFEAISALADTANLDHLLAKAVAAALAVTGGHEGWIGILQAQQLHCVTADGQRFDLPAADLWDPSTQDGQGPVGLIVRNQQALIIPNIASEPMLNPWLNEMLDSGIKSAAGFPLMSQGELLGILKVYHSQIGGFTPGRIRRLQALSSLATALIERSLSTLASEAHARRQEIMARGLAAMNTLDTRDDLVQLLVATVSDFGP